MGILEKTIYWEVILPCSTWFVATVPGVVSAVAIFILHFHLRWCSLVGDDVFFRKEITLWYYCYFILTRIILPYFLGNMSLDCALLEEQNSGDTTFQNGLGDVYHVAFCETMTFIDTLQYKQQQIF